MSATYLAPCNESSNETLTTLTTLTVLCLIDVLALTRITDVSLNVFLPDAYYQDALIGRGYSMCLRHQ